MLPQRMGKRQDENHWVNDDNDDIAQKNKCSVFNLA